MMSSLFSIFDTSTNNIIELNWFSSIFNMFMFPLSYWFNSSRLTNLIQLVLIILFKEFKIIFNNKFNWLNSLFFVALFWFIFVNNFMGLFPYIFTSSSHLIFSITFSLPLWLGLMIFGWLNNTNFMLSHLIPQGTPNMLMPFMIMIETISNLIRPSTLAIRLTANMIAGHLLLTLLSNTAMSPSLIVSILIILIQLSLLGLEISVSMIQSYVFTILSSLYSKETN